MWCTDMTEASKLLARLNPYAEQFYVVPVRTQLLRYFRKMED